MRVQVVCIRHMRVFMTHWFVAMPMAVLPQGHDIVGMQMVRIIMRMCMFVLKLAMVVFVTVRLKQVKHHADQHQYAPCCQHPGA